jgi:nitrate reductase molybdenum cofactor assembly chaperone NarJ/NarW
MLGLKKKSPDRAAGHERLRAWTRERFTLANDDTIMVSQIACSAPGCPPVETHVVFWTQAGRHHFKIFKPLAEVDADDVPPAFMKNALVAPEGFDCDCC